MAGGSSWPPGGSRIAAPAAVAAVVLATALGATWVGWRFNADAVEERRRASFEFRLHDVEARIVERLQGYEQALRGAAGLFAATSQIDRAAFRRYVGSIDLARGCPGIQALGFLRLVPAAGLEAHQAALRREGFPDYLVRPRGPGDVHAPVVFVEPFSGPNPRSLGLDPLDEPVPRQAMERARDLGTAALSGRVDLVMEPGPEGRPGAVLYLPVYRGGERPGTVEARRDRLVGWVYAAFLVRDLMAGLLGERAGDVDVEVYDGDRPSVEAELFDQDGFAFARSNPQAGFRALRPIELAGRRWTLAVRSLGRFEARLGGDRPRLVVASGVVASLLLAALAWLLAASRVRVHEALQRSESLHQLVMRNFPNGGVALFDRELRFKLADGAATPGLPEPRAWRDRTLAEVFPPGWRPALEQACRAALEGRTVKEEQDLEGRTLEATFHPVHDLAGQVTMGVVITQDVTERRALQAQRSVAARLAAMGTLVAGVAHEINNPLAGQVSSHALAGEAVERARRVLRGPGPPDVAALAALLDEVQEEVADAQAGARRIARIVKDLAAFGRPSQARQRLRLADVVERALRWSSGLARPEVAVRVEDAHPPDVLATAGQLEQVVMNLLGNAAWAIPAGTSGAVTIRLGTSEAGAARLEVSDTGRGIDPAVAERIFDPFFTTRDVGQGTGLGLSVCHAIVTAHGGTITASSVPGRGSTFRVELPACPPAAPPGAG